MKIKLMLERIMMNVGGCVYQSMYTTVNNFHTSYFEYFEISFMHEVFAADRS